MKIRRRLPEAAMPTAPFAAAAFLLFLLVVATGMVSSPGGIGIAFRSAAEAAALPPEDSSTVHVRVLSENEALIAGLRVQRDDWPAGLARAIGERKRPVVTLHADPGAPFEAVLAMLALAAGDPAKPESAPRIAIPTRAQVQDYRKRYGRDPFEASP